MLMRAARRRDRGIMVEADEKMMRPRGRSEPRES